MKLILILILICFLPSDGSTWELIYKRNGVELYKGKSYESILPFRAEAVLDVSAKKIFDTLMDWENKHNWSPKLKRVVLHKALGNNKFIFSEYYSTPWPSSDREFLMVGEYKVSANGNFIFSATSLKSPSLIQIYRDKRYVQADVKNILFSGEKLSATRTKVTFEFQGDIKGWIPKWLSNIIQRKWPLRFIEELNVISKN